MYRQGKTIMLQGTASDVGKSILTAALCRIFKQDGYRTAPFKSQNMSNNSYITLDGFEIGVAQGMQAEACGVAATTDMNPILLKPSGEMRSQVVVHGKPLSDMDARAYRERYLNEAGEIVKRSLQRLREQYDIIVMEGAGSPAEINLKDRDIVNMQAAEWADAPVLLVADIDRGGMFASVIGTLELLEPHERSRVKGIIVNKFRGDVSLLMPGIRWLEERTGIPVAGIVPYMHDMQLEDEDSASLDRKLDLQDRGRSLQTNRNNGRDNRHYGRKTDTEQQQDVLDIGIIRLPRISNFTDFDPLLAEPDVRVRYIRQPSDWGEPTVIIIPGSKNTAEDMQYLRASGLADRMMQFADSGGMVVGICGGYQMLGTELRDPHKVESSYETLPGLGLLRAITEFSTDKRTVRVQGWACGYHYGGVESQEQHKIHNPVDPKKPIELPTDRIHITGYEIHLGHTTFTAPLRPMFYTATVTPDFTEHDSPRQAFVPEGAMNDQGNVWGTYIHGIFHNDNWRHVWLNTVRRMNGLPEYERPTPYQSKREGAFDRLADHVRGALNMELIYQLLGEERN